jgi:hypothetical protein
MSVITRMPETAVLAVHITIALALTMTVGVQSSQLARLRGDMPTPPAVRALRAALWSTSILALLTFATGIAVLADGRKGGPWLSAGVLSTLAIALASIWVRWRLRRNIIRRTGMVGAVQWGVPAMTLAAAFLMADRPQNVLTAVAPVAVAVAVAAFAYRAAARSVTT